MTSNCATQDGMGVCTDSVNRIQPEDHDFAAIKDFLEEMTSGRMRAGMDVKTRSPLDYRILRNR